MKEVKGGLRRKERETKRGGTKQQARVRVLRASAATIFIFFQAKDRLISCL